jgi:hypothetical protein
MRQWKTSSPAFLTPSCLWYRASQNTKPFTQSGSYSNPTCGQLTPTWGGHLGLIVSDAAYAMVTPATSAGPTLWVNPTFPRRALENLDLGTAAQLSAARHVWEGTVVTYRTFNTVQQAHKKQIITVFEPMYLDILNDDMVGFSNISAREMLYHLFMTYGNITAVDLEHNFEQMYQAWDPHQHVGSLFKQIQDCANVSEAGGFIIGHPQHINARYANIFATWHFMSACCRWNKKPNIEKTWAQGTLLRCARKCRVNQQQPQGVMHKTPLWVRQRTKWLRPPFMLWPT